MSSDAQASERGTASNQTEAGQAVYSPLLLRIYDWYVLGLSSRMIWRCPASRMLAHYDRHVGARHLDVGVGTGFFLDRCRFPTPSPELVLMDMNRNSLAHCSRRVARYAPEVVVGDALEQPPLERRSFDSIGLNFLIHCLPARVEGGKWKLFANLAPLLRPDGTLFGSTILGAGLDLGLAQRKLMGAYQRKGIFDNGQDSLEQLEAGLRAQFEEVEVELSGIVALFSARSPRPR